MLEQLHSASSWLKVNAFPHNSQLSKWTSTLSQGLVFSLLSSSTLERTTVSQ